MRALAALALAVLVLPAFAGCLTDSATAPQVPSPALLPATVQCPVAELCNLIATAEPDRQSNELSVAVNPLDPKNIIATGKDYKPSEAGDCTWAGIYTTKDGGLTWKQQNVPGSPWKRLQDPTTPITPFSKYWCATDPVVVFGPDGTAYWTVMPYQCDAVSGSKTGRGILPQGGFNDWAFTCSSMFVLVSTDGGETWPIEKVREVATGPQLVHDKQWIAVSPDGNTVVLCWDFAGGASTTPDNPVANPAAAVVCTHSKDKGDTWTQFADTKVGGLFPWIEFGPDGRLWMVTTNGFESGDFQVSSTTDLVNWEPPVKVGTFVNGEGRNEYGWPTLKGSSFRVVPVASLAVDRSTGPYSGRIYVTYFDHAAGNGDTLLVWSDDGKTWSAPVRVNDDGDSPHDQFMPVVSVGPDGTVDVSWQDRRDDPGNHLFHTYYAYSVDGGVTFSPNLRVTDVMSDEQYSHHQNGMIFLGDYRDSDSVAGAATFIWVDTRNQKADAVVATVARPGVAG
ncbi:MAG TPA: sialidase family protein [Candidatus Thermoplasmatota archaeon]|nr:sialidase family protein [Candidatus Thermoplasmatota archaeon]